MGLYGENDTLVGGVSFPDSDSLLVRANRQEGNILPSHEYMAFRAIVSDESTTLTEKIIATSRFGRILEVLTSAQKAQLPEGAIEMYEIITEELFTLAQNP